MSRYPRYRSPFRLKLKRKTTVTLLGAAIFAISFLTIVSFFIPAPLLSILRGGSSKLFGWSSFLFFFIFLLGSLSLLGFRARFVQANVIFGICISLLSILAFSALLSPESAGVLGSVLWIGVSYLLTPVGAFFLFAVIFFVGIIILTNTSLDRAISFLITAFALGRKGIVFFLHRRFKRAPVSSEPPVSRDDALVPAQKQPLVKIEPGTVKHPVTNISVSGQIWRYPPLSLLSDNTGSKADRGDLNANKQIIEKKLASFGIEGKVVETNLGPAITQYAISIPLGTKISKITALSNDLALALATPTGNVRIEAPIPGKSLIGIEIPNRSLEVVSLKSILSSDVITREKSKLAVALGQNVAGQPVVADIEKMPHILIAGTTGSGKSVLLNSFIASILFRAAPFETKLILVDPKRVELSSYNDIPHLLAPVIVDLEKILSSLKWLMVEMERRYKLFAQTGVKNLFSYNETVGFQALPYILVVIDELADLMSFAPVEVEDAICRLAQMARATGIHLVVATQRPSVDVITGLIKANISCRIAFNVSSMVDSRVILDQPGAEKLLGRGDMLYLPPDVSKPQRIQGVFVSDSELQNLLSFLRASGVEPQYEAQVTEMPYSPLSGRRSPDSQDALFEEAIRTVCQYDRASASLLQRRLSIGYARAARLLDALEAAGIVGPGEGSKPRDVLVRNADEFLAKSHEERDQEEVKLP